MRAILNTPKYSQCVLHFPDYRADGKLQAAKGSVLCLVESNAFFPDGGTSQEQSFMQIICQVLKPILDLNNLQGM